MGPAARETVALLRELPAPFVLVRGNAERALFEFLDDPARAERLREQWMLEAHSEDDVAFVRQAVEGSTAEVDGLGPVRFCHGSPRSDEELITYATPEDRLLEAMEGRPERVLVSAHTHIQFDREAAGIRSINPGSVGMPYMGEPGAFWAVLGPDVELRRTAYDVDEAVRRYRESDDPLAEQMVEILLAPPTPGEVIASEEERPFAG